MLHKFEHVHLYVYVFVYICHHLCVCVCVCVCVFWSVSKYLTWLSIFIHQSIQMKSEYNFKMLKK